MNARSLSFRLVAWYAGVLTGVFVLLGLLTFSFLRHSLEANVLDAQARRARQIAGTLVAQVPRESEGALRGEVEKLYSPEINDRFIRISRADGHVVYASATPRSELFDPARVPPIAGDFLEGAARKVAVPGGGALLIAAVPATGSDGTLYRVEVGTSAASAENTLAQVLFMLAVGLPVAVAVAVAGGFILVRRALEPVERMAVKAEEITQHSLSERLPVVRSGDELERLSISLNHMISRLEDALRVSKQFVADASHELRTPLTVMRGELESLAQDGRLARETREALGSVLEEVERLAEIVESLFALSRLDAGEAGAWQRFDLAELANTTAEQMSLLATDKRIRVNCESTPGVNVRGDRARLKQVIVNLLDNAIKYTPDGGRVTLRVRREGAHAVLDVADTGIGIPPEALPHVFKRFFRVDGSRSREQGGAGLGLSIVKSICAAHGAEVEVVSTPGEGSTFRVRQPLAAESTERA
jgi:heavy metal sensor kinase